MAKKNSDSERVGGPGAAHENRKSPEKSQPRGEKPADTKNQKHSGISGGGGEHDSHHSHRLEGKAGH
jgi:hypothetical protein